MFPRNLKDTAMNSKRSLKPTSKGLLKGTTFKMQWRHKKTKLYFGQFTIIDY